MATFRATKITATMIAAAHAAGTLPSTDMFHMSANRGLSTLSYNGAPAVVYNTAEYMAVFYIGYKEAVFGGVDPRNGADEVEDAVAEDAAYAALQAIS